VDGEALAASGSGAAPIDLFGLKGFMIGFSSSSGNCGAVKALGMTASLMIQLCDVSPGVHDLEDDCIEGEGGGVALSNSIKLTRPGADVSATSGSVTIEAFDATCGGAVRGSFTADFDGQSVSGSFDTVSCALVQL